MTDVKFYKSPRWLSKRDSILRRDKYECQNCRRYFRSKEAKVVHHIYFYDDYWYESNPAPTEYSVRVKSLTPRLVGEYNTANGTVHQDLEDK